MAERKKFIDVDTGILGNVIQVLGTAKELDTKTIKLDLSRKMRGKGVMITLQMFNKDESLITAPKRIEIMKSYLRRIIRKRTDIVEDSFSVKCADVRATMKPFLITRKRVSRAVRRNLRNTAREFLTEYAKEKPYVALCDELLAGSLQKEMLPKLKKVYPLAFCDVRVFESKDLAKLDLDELMKYSERSKEEDTTEAESEVAQKVEEEAVEEAVEQAEEGESEHKEEGEEAAEGKAEEKTVKKAAKKTTKKATKKDTENKEE